MWYTGLELRGFCTKTRPFPIPWLALVNFEPNISRIYTPQLQSWVSLLRSTPMKMERIESSETSAPKLQAPGDYTKDTIYHWDYSILNPIFEAFSFELTLLLTIMTFSAPAGSWPKYSNHEIRRLVVISCSCFLVCSRVECMYENRTESHKQRFFVK